MSGENISATKTVSSDVPYPPPTKEEIIKALKEENPPIDSGGKYNQYFLVVEIKRLTPRLGIYKGEFYHNDTLDYRGSLLIPLSNNDTGNGNNEPSVWKSIAVGESNYYGLSLDTRELTLGEKFSQFIKRSFEEGKLQDFIP